VTISFARTILFILLDIVSLYRRCQQKWKKSYANLAHNQQLILKARKRSNGDTVVCVQAIGNWGSGGIAPIILYLGTEKKMCRQFHDTAVLVPSDKGAYTY